MPVTINEARFPLILVEFRPPFTDENVDTFAEAMRRLIKSGKPHAMVFDPAGIMTMGAAQRAKMSALAKETEAQSKDLVVCSCIVIDNAIARGVITAINWASPPSFEQKFMRTVPDAIAHATQRLGARGLTVPDA